MTDPRPLWEVIEQAWWSSVDTENLHCSPPASDQAAYVIRAVRDWLVPEERTLGPVWFGTVVEHESNWRQGLRALLTAEAARAQRQPVPPLPGEVEE